MLIRHAFGVLSLGTLLTLPVYAISLSEEAEQRYIGVRTATVFDLLSPHSKHKEVLPSLQGVSNGAVQVLPSSPRRWQLILGCPETPPNWLGGGFSVRQELTLEGHAKLIGKNGQEAYFDFSPAKDKIPRGPYTIDEKGVRFYARGNCNFFPRESTQDLNDKWYGGPLHDQQKFNDLTQLPWRKKLARAFKNILR